MERTCPLCGRTNRPRAHSCHYCGQKLPPLAEPVPKQGHGFGTFAAFVGVFALLTALLFTGFVTPGFFRGQAEELPEPEASQQLLAAAPMETPAPTPPPAATPRVPTFRNPFVDVIETDPFFQPIAWAIDEGVASGSGPLFRPQDGCTRAQALTFLYRAVGSPHPSRARSPYADVKSGIWFYSPVLWALEQGVISESEDARFYPGDLITRAQAITILYRVALNTGLAEEVQGTEPCPFSDISTYDYFYDAALWAYRSGVSSGIGDGCFGAWAAVNKAQMLTFLYRVFGEGTEYQNRDTAPDFEKLGILCDIEVGVPVAVSSVDYNRYGYVIPGTMTVERYEVFQSDDRHAPKAGHEWRSVTFTLDFRGMNANSYGVASLKYCRTDYYHIRLFDETCVFDEQGEFTARIHWNGEETELNGRFVRETPERYLYRYTYDIQVPTGYDGFVAGFMVDAVYDPEGTHLYEIYNPNDFWLFRLN